VSARYSVSLVFRSAFFGTVEYQLDLYGVEEPQRLAPLFQQVRANLERAGVQLVGNDPGRVVEQTTNTVWDEASLYATMLRSDFFGPRHRPTGPRWRVYLMVVPLFRSANDTGLMFDTGGHKFPRQGAAVSCKGYGDP